MQLRKSAHTVYKTQYHIVFVTKYRRKILVKGVSQYLKQLFQEIGKFRPDVEFIEIGCDKDHVHLYMVIPPKYAVSDIVKAMKANTAKKLKAKFAFLEKVYWGTDSIWSTGFFVSTVGADEQTIKNYVKWQGQEDFGQAQLEL
jgi:putative transposase